MLCFGTTVLAVALADRIVVGADSLLYDSNGKKSSGCKIAVVDNTVVAVAGILGDPAAGWAALDVASEVLRQPGTIEEHASKYLARLRNYAAPPLQAMRLQNYPEFKKMLGKPMIQVLFAVGLPAPRCLAFAELLEESGARDVGFQLLADVIDSGSPGSWRGLGHEQHIRRFLNFQPTYFDSSAELPERLRTLVSLEIAANPDKVGGKIAIVEVGQQGVRWVDPGECGQGRPADRLGGNN